MIACPTCGHLFEPPTPPGLTPRQIDAFRFIAGYIAERGFAPTVREIGAGIGAGSISRVVGILRGLEERGALVRRTRRASGIVITNPMPAESRPG